MINVNLTGIRACVFDAYGTLFDVNSAAQRTQGIADLLDAVLSVEELKVYKPYPAVYQLAVDRLSLKASAICYVSSNGWDSYSAKAFGFHAIWCNRSSQVPERIPETPDAEIRTLSDLLEINGVA
jgi:2-haloacid dehalogenase